jgi:hypothetical protein
MGEISMLLIRGRGRRLIVRFLVLLLMLFGDVPNWKIGLLESKGVHHTQPGEPKSEDLDKGKEAGKSPKPSLKEKIKAKLHRNKDDKD